MLYTQTHENVACPKMENFNILKLLLKLKFNIYHNGKKLGMVACACHPRNSE
jgi:hypothetical protein